MVRQTKHVTALDGVRGLGVAAVVIHHLQFPHLGGLYIGVDIFFALSGFLITSSLLRDNATRLRSFWARRAWRVGPAAAVLLGWYVAVSLGDPQRHLRLSFARVAALQYINIDMANGPPPGSTSPHLGHLWSLAAEIQFYAVWPLVLLLVLRRRATPAAVFALSAAIAGATGLLRWHLAASGQPWGRLYFGPDVRSTALFTGAAVAGLVAWRAADDAGPVLRSLDRVAAFLVLPAVAVFGWYGWSASLTWRPGLTWGLTLVALSAAVLVLHASGDRPSPVNRLLCTRPLTYLGSISYSLYLWHVPVIALVVARWPDITTPTKALVVVPASLVLAIGSYRFVERPLMSQRSRRALLATAGA
ncbi:MAG: putative rane protein [Acidimicrobiales bacterium]|nr:putative rane protein [Acidimicrobiales bacterium]